MRDLVELSDDQIEQAFQDMGAGITIDEVIFTQDTIADFIDAAKKYVSHGSIEQDENTLLIENVQTREGQTFTDLYVIDFGDVRGCWK